MAWPNIDERRAFVADLINKGVKIDHKIKLEVAQKLNCHVSAIYADVKYFQKLRYQGKIGDENLEGWNPVSNLPQEINRIITPDEFLKGQIDLIVDRRVLEYFYSHPEQIYSSLNPRQFEEFVANILANLGYSVQVSPIGADEGIDIYAERKHIIGAELVLVQCKHFQNSIKVSRPVVQQLKANVFDKSASSGLVVTTSTFTKPAWNYINQAKYRLAGADNQKLQEWLAYIKRNKGF